MRIYRSDKGFLCAESEGKNIHSRYNPDREAARFIETAIKGFPSVIVLLGAGLGYIQKAITDQFPQSLVLAVYHNGELYKNRQINHRNVFSWYPSSNQTIETFFQNYISESKLSGLSVIEWEPSAQIFPKLSLQINQVLKQYIQQLNGNIQTTAFFGKQWLRNLLVNFLSTEKYCMPRLPRAPYLIASSGPSLERSLAEMKKYRDRFVLFALPSSLKALAEHGISPDIQISTDPGYYSGVHLSHLFKNIPLAQPFTAGRGSWRKSAPLFLLNQSTPYESDLFLISGIKSQKIPSNGTVSGTALELAAPQGNAIYFAGLDLCFSDIQSHVAPHSFDSLLRMQSRRTNPIYSIYYRRAFPTDPDFRNKIRTGRSLDTYRNWFSRYGHLRDMEIKRLNPSPVTIDNINEGNLSEITTGFAPKVTYELADAPSLNKRKEIVDELLSLWIRRIENGDGDELFYFIDTEKFTGNKDTGDAIRFLNRLKKFYGR